MTTTSAADPQPIQPVDRPILCSPWAEPTAYWQYDRDTAEAREIPGRRGLIVACAEPCRF